MQKAKCPNVLRILENFFDSNGDVYMVLEYCEYDLHSLIYVNHLNEAPIRFIKSYFKQLLRAISVSHGLNIIHRDLKPSNVLITSNNVVKLADFGLSQQLQQLNIRRPENVYTPGYRAPEIILRDENYGAPSDIWSLGIILIEMLTGTQPFTPCSSIEFCQLSAIFEIIGYPTGEDFEYFSSFPQSKSFLNMPKYPNKLRALLSSVVDSSALNLLERMLAFNPKNRPTVDEILNDSFFSDSDFAPESEIKLTSLRFAESHAMNSPEQFINGPEFDTMDDILRPELIPIAV